MRANLTFGPLRKEVIHEENLDRNGAGPVRSRSNDRLGMRIQRRDVRVRRRPGTACNGVTSGREQSTRTGGGEGSAVQASEAGWRQDSVARPGCQDCPGRCEQLDSFRNRLRARRARAFLLPPGPAQRRPRRPRAQKLRTVALATALNASLTVRPAGAAKPRSKKEP